jgi:O-Antigen ligase
MSRRRKEIERGRRERGDVSAVAAAKDAAAADDRPDALRPWLLAGATALIVARPLVLSDGGPWIGDGEPFAALWIILAIMWTLGALGRPRLRLRFTWTDAAVAAFFAWWVLAASHGAESGAPRPSFNVLWDGMAALIAFLLLRQLAPVGREARAIVVVMIALGVVLAAISFHQYFFTLPADRARLKENPQETLREAGVGPIVPGSPEFELYRSRLETTEALATFSLTNSLAAFLAPWLIVTLGIAVAARQDVTNRRRTWLATALCGLPIAAALMLTRSRSAWIAAGIGALILWLLARAGTAPNRRRRWPIAAGIAAVVVAGSVAIWRPASLEPAIRSFSFRLEYWQSTLAMIRDHLWLGCGPGNFGDYYTFYKLPIAAEEIKDPHNFLFEIAANAGLPALLAFALVVVGLVRRARRAAKLPTPGDIRGESDTTPWIFGGATLAVALAMMLNLILGFSVRAEEMIAGILFGGLVIAAFHSWVQRGRLTPTLLSVGIAVLLIALLAVGGFTFAGVAGTLWLLLALIFSATDPPEARRSLPRSAAFLLFVGAGALAAAQHQTGYQPVMKYNAAIDAAEAAAEHKSLDEVERQLLNAGKEDPWAVYPWHRLAEYRLDQWLHSPPAARDQHNLDDFDHYMTDHVLAFWPRSSAAWHDAGLGWLAAYKEMPSRKSWAKKAVLCCGRALALYPNSAYLKSQLAAAYSAAGDPKLAQSTAREALRLDDLMPHEDRKLPADVRRETTHLAAGEGPKDAPPLPPRTKPK